MATEESKPEELYLTEDEDFEDGTYDDDYEHDYGKDMADFDDDD